MWNVNDGTVNGTLTGNYAWILALVTLLNGDLVSGSFGVINIWNLNNVTVKNMFNCRA